MDNNKNIPSSFDLPDGYFKNSKTGILNKIEWMQEHEAYPTLLRLNKESGFIVPENYFNKSASKLELLDAPSLLNIAQHLPVGKAGNGFEVPANYFEENKTRIASLVEEGNELSAYPRLSSIEKKNPFVTSENYFETNKKAILSKNEGGAKIISLFSKPVRYAAAAAIMITIGLWIYHSYFRAEVEGDCTTLACFEKRDIIKYKLNNFDVEDMNDASIDLNKLEMNLNKKESSKNDSLKTTDSTDEALLDYID